MDGKYTPGMNVSVGQLVNSNHNTGEVANSNHNTCEVANSNHNTCEVANSSHNTGAALERKMSEKTIVLTWS